jgi:hypothetical protein
VIEANLQTTPRPVFRIRGRLNSFGGGTPVELQLLRDGLDMGGDRAVVDPGTGNFEIPDVTPGSYLLRAKSYTMPEKRAGVYAMPEEIQAEESIRVRDSNIDRLNLSARRGVDLVAIVQHDGGGQPLARIELIPADRPADKTSRSSVSSGIGREVIHSVLPGSYWVNVTPLLRSFVVAATYNGADLLHGSVLTITPGVPPDQIHILLSSKGGAVVVTLPPSETKLSILMVPASGAEAVSESSYGGEFMFGKVAVGDYRVYLVPLNSAVEYRNPAALQVMNGQTVHVAEGDTARVEIREVAK